MGTGEFLRRYFYVYLYVVAFFLACSTLLLRSVEVAGTEEGFGTHPVIVIDPGHGGMDGGTTGISGVGEKDVNLAIAGRLEAVLGLMGYETVMTRSTDESLSTEGDTIRRQKQSDLRNRAAMVNEQANAILVSIHQNHYPDSRYFGPQVFYSGDAEALAGQMQSALNVAFAQQSKRSVKKASGVYLMEHISHPGLLIECGFLSNPTEEQKLTDPDYQKKLAWTMASVLAKFADGGV